MMVDADLARSASARASISLFTHTRDTYTSSPRGSVVAGKHPASHLTDEDPHARLRHPLAR
jgi:hypothetical protein